jgi:hypothetical protein
MVKSKKLLAFLFLLMLGISSLFTVYAIPENKEEKRAEKILDLSYKSMLKAEEAINAGVTAGLDTSIINQALDNYTEGAALWDLANTTFHGAEPVNYTKVIELAVSATPYFKLTIRTVMSHWGETGASAGWRGLSGVIDRLEAFLNRTEDLVETAILNYPGYDFTNVENNLDEARQHLDFAMGNLTDLDIDAAAKEIGNVNSLLNKITNELKKIGQSSAVKGKRIGKFVDHQLQKLIEKAEELAGEAGEDITAEMNDVDLLIAEIEAFMLAENYEDAMGKVNETRKFLNDLIKDLRKATKGP